MISSMSGRPAGWRATAPLRLPYDWTLHRAAEVRAVGYDFEGYYGWHYPPPAFFFAAALASLPYLIAAVVWLLTTLAAYVAAIAGILGLRTGVLFALGFPAAIWNVTAGQETASSPRR